MIHPPSAESPRARTLRILQTLAVGIAKGQEAERRQDAEHDGHGFPEPDGARDGRAAEDDGGQQAQLDAVGLAVLDSVASEGVYRMSALLPGSFRANRRSGGRFGRRRGFAALGLTQKTD